MISNPDANKPTERLYLPIAIIFHMIPPTLQGMILCPSNKHLELILDNKLTYCKHIDDKTNKANTEIVIIRRLYIYLPRNALLQVYKSLIRPHLDYCDVIYHKPIYDDTSKVYYSDRALTDPMNTNS